MILRQTYLSVYINFDFWILLNNIAYVDVIYHFIEVNNQLRLLLLVISNI